MIVEQLQSGPSWGQVGLLLRPPGPSWCPSCLLSAPSWGKIGQTWACLEPFGAYLAHPGPSSGQLTASLCFYVAVVDLQQCSQPSCALSRKALATLPSEPQSAIAWLEGVSLASPASNLISRPSQGLAHLVYVEPCF